MAKTPGGITNIIYSLKVARKVGFFKFWKSIRSKNTCKTCAYGMGGQKGGMRNEIGGFPEICNKSMQAQLTDIQGAIPANVFEKNSIDDLRGFSGKDIEALGRLNTPLFKKKDSNRYSPVSWDEAIKIVADKFKSTQAGWTFFYASGRSSNEAAFILHLFARLYGTNNVNNCSYYCHQASGVGLSKSIGSGTATIVLEDLAQTDLIFVIGANPASNHPRYLKELIACRRRGGKVIVINPAKEPGLVRFAIPSNFRSIIVGGDEVASMYVQPNIGGDIALLKGIAKAIIEKNAPQQSFIDNHTNGFADYRSDVESVSWEQIEASCGVSRENIEKIAQDYIEAKNVVFSWAMGITHHIHGVENVQSIVNVALLRGMVGRKSAGLLPLRGHSNVQGVGSVGVTPVLKEKVFENIQKLLNVVLPTEPGFDTMACMKAALEGNVDVAFLLGGNLYGSNPDSKFAAESLAKIPFKVFLSTTMNPGHVNGVGEEQMILPVAARDEEKQSTTQESMFNFVRLSDGGIVRLDNVRSEVDIICDVAAGVLGNSPVDFSEFKKHSKIREAIAKTIPGFAEIETIDQTKKEFQIDGRTFHTPKFGTADGKANFQVIGIPQNNSNGRFRMMTVRSEGQFNTIVYENEDVLREQTDRWVVMMNAADIEKLGIKTNDKVTIETSVGKMNNVTARAFDIPCGNVIAYYPEANILTSTEVDPSSKTPAFKNVPVTILRE
ncbi:MAG: FdhF/YdeP family oxidoreductase [Planctomycetes bacterium]|nr:FdhF/YdeP family oxidoreductase [Planctomycetota bacterium]